MLLLAWGASGLPVALPASPPGKTRAMESFRFMLDADTCLAPEDGLFTPRGFTPYRMLVRDLLLGDSTNQTVLQVVVSPSFASPYSLRLEERPRTDDDVARPAPYQLRLVRAKKHPWVQMMDEMHRQQGDVIRLGDAEQQSALSAVSRATEVKTVPVAASVANHLAAIWAGALARTQYANEITTAPDGSQVGTAKLDGTTYDFWHDDRSGKTHSPENGSLLGDLVVVVETLTRYADASQAKQPVLEKQLVTQLDRLQHRLKRNEPCLRPLAPRTRNH